jgi:hypothetical protein
MVRVRSLTPLPNSPHQPVRALIDLHEHAYLHKLLASTLRAHAASKDLFPGTPAFACTRVRMHIGKRREASERDRDREIEPWAEKHRFPIPHSSFITNTHTHTHTHNESSRRSTGAREWAHTRQRDRHRHMGGPPLRAASCRWTGASATPTPLTHNTSSFS